MSQGSKWTMADKLVYNTYMMINKIIHYVVYSLWLKYIDFQFNEPTNQNTIKVKPTNKKTLL